MPQVPVSSRQGLPPVWVINMPRSTERRARISKHLDELGLAVEFVDAVDGGTFSPEDCRRLSDPEKSRELLGRELAPAEIACSLSHRMLYQRQIDEGHEAVIILEDDAVIDPVFFEIMDLRSALPRDWELVLFHRGDTRVSVWGSHPLGRWRLVKFASLAYITVAYMLRQSGAQKLLAYNDPVVVPADFLTGGALRTGVHLYGIDPPCARELSTDSAASSMPEVRALRPRWPLREEMHPIAWRLHRIKWSVIHTCQRINPLRIL